MDEKKNIDRLFQEKFKDFEVLPDPSVWENIEKQIQKKKKRRVIPLWWRIGGAAAILLLAVFSGLLFFNNDNNIQETPDEIIITKTDEDDNQNTKKTPSVKDEELTSPKPILKNQDDNLISGSNTKTKQKKSDNSGNIAIIKKDKEVINKPQLNETNNSQGISVLTEKQEIENGNKIDKQELNSALIKEKMAVANEEVSDKDEMTKVDLQSEIEKMKDADDEKIVKEAGAKWSVGSAVAPIYYSTLTNGSPIDQNLANNNMDGSSSLSYGIKFNYKLSDRLSLQSGVNAVELGYTTQNVTALVSSSLLENSSTNITTNVDGVSVAAVATAASQNTESVGQRSSLDLSGDLDQTMGYVEIPLEAKYRLSQRKVGINVIGGFSTYVLYKNQVAITSFGKKTTLGEASNVNDLNFSGNVGLDFDYNISKKLYINVSPMFKYQFNTFSENSGGFQPYYFGVYTGLNFRF